MHIPKKSIEVVVERGTAKKVSEELLTDSPADAQQIFWQEFDSAMYIEDHTRQAKKIMNDYAVSILPFVLIKNENGDAIGAVYSEEGPVTLDRIIEKV